ncbi:MAG TPA: YdeI/OmpD-associated family protein [Candidatus Nanoarchaeia archaeon]|nr:YdeI/OmpD-associated family protein [Candidatus Nanoarchaeia archaeon]
MIKTKVKLYNLGSWKILRLPKDASAKLPSRGMVMIEGTINEIKIKTTLEPDGDGSHWFKVDETLLKSIKANAGHRVTLTITPTKEWTEPPVPSDLKTALTATPQAYKIWNDITPMARWDWIRWIRATKNAETRKKRITIACSKLKSGMRRPCCFDRSQCTEPYISDKGVLRESN